MNYYRLIFYSVGSNIFILTLVAIKKIQSLIQRDKDMSKHPNLTSGPLINGAGIVSKTFSLVLYYLNI